jgi:hypothetical protein
MHELDYNELTKNKNLWENEEALLNGYRSLKYRCLSIDEQIKSLGKQKKEIADKCSVVGKQLIKVSGSNKNKHSFKPMHGVYDSHKDPNSLEIPLGKSRVVDSILEELSDKPKNI